VPDGPSGRAGDPAGSSQVSLADALVELQELARRLRRDCPWDREQTALTIVPHTVEEAYEVADAAASGDADKLLDELGDLLFQVYFLALLLSEEGHGDLETVARGIHAKLVRRHPHVFGDAEASTAWRVRDRWEEIKSEQEGRVGIFHDVPGSLPALVQARKLQRRAVAAGFDWPDLEGPLAKVREELGELEAEVARTGEPSPETEADAKVAHEALTKATKDDDANVQQIARAALAQLLDWTAPLLNVGTIGLFPKGRDAEIELTEARKQWTFEAETLPSSTDSSARILRITSIESHS